MPRAIRRVAAVGIGLDRAVRRAALDGVDAVIGAVSRNYGPRGVAARSWPTGGATVWVVLLLAATLVIYYW